MRPNLLRIVAFCALVICAGCGKPADRNLDRVISVDSDDAEMNAAMARARSEVDTAIQKLQGGEFDSFSIKVPITEGNQTEYFWLNDVKFQDGVFSGAIDNDPEDVHNVKLGDHITVKKDEISDWLYMKDGKMHGNYTLRVLLKKMTPAEAAEYRKELVD